MQLQKIRGGENKVGEWGSKPNYREVLSCPGFSTGRNVIGWEVIRQICIEDFAYKSSTMSLTMHECVCI